MGLGGIGAGSLILILVIVILLFGTKKLRNVGSDLGGALKNFRKAIKDGDESADANASQIEEQEGKTIDSEAVREKEKDKG